MRNHSIPFVIAIACGSLSACEPAADRSITLTAADSGRTVPVAAGTVVAIALPTTPGTGYSWSLTDTGGSVLELLDTGVVSRDSAAPAKPGGPATSTWRFRARQQGAASVKLDYRRPWEREAPAARHFEVNLEVGRTP